MISRSEVYRCGICGNIVEVLHAGGGTLVCCGEPMKLQTENTVDAAREKHVPVIERSPTGVTVKVGGVAHPMEEKHWIQWVELIAGERLFRKYLKPGDKPEATFPPVEAGTSLTAREYCNLHGHWKAS